MYHYFSRLCLSFVIPPESLGLFKSNTLIEPIDM